MSSMPKLPARKGALSQGSSKPAAPSAEPVANLHQEMLSQVSRLTSNPAVMRLMQSPELLDAVKERDPTLRALLEQNPQMSELLAPDKLQSVMEIVKDPSLMRAHGAAVFGGLDLSKQFQAVEQLESHRRNLQSRAQPPQPGQAQGGGEAQPTESSAAARFAMMQSRMQQLQTMMARASQTAAAAGDAHRDQRPWAAGMAPPNQPVSFFMPPSVPHGHSAAASATATGSAGQMSGGGEGGFSFTHSEREINLADLPLEAQERLLAANGVTREALGLASAGHGAAGSGAAAAGEPGGGAPGDRLALPSFETWKQQQEAAAAVAAQGLPPSAWGGALDRNATHGSPTHALPTSMPSFDGASRGGAAAAAATAAMVSRGMWEPQPQQPQHHHHGGSGPGHGGCCANHDHGHGHHHHHHHGGGDPYDAFGGQYGLYGLGGGPAVKMRPRDYYEPVVPNLVWRAPEVQEGCGSLYRRAYSSYCDMMFFPPFFAVAALLVAVAPGIPFWLLVAGLVAVAIPGAWCFVVVLAGLPKEKLPVSRNFMSLIATCEVLYPLVYGWRVLPYWHGLTSSTTLVLLAGFIVMPILHMMAATADPGFVPSKKQLQYLKAAAEGPPPTTAGQQHAKAQGQGQGQGQDKPGREKLGEEEQAQRGLLATTGGDVEAAVTGGPAAASTSTGGGAAAVVAAAAAAAAAAPAMGLGVLNLTAPLPDDDDGVERQPLLAGPSGGAVAAAAGERDRMCSTCEVPRPLRSKHCQYCNRCVRRFDHHCPAIANCVGEANERSFAAWLFVMWVTQVLVVYVAVSFILQRHLAVSGAVAASSAPDTGPRAVWAALCWGASGPERGLVLMALLQALCLIPGSYLASRQLYCILANLTANELINRNRYKYLQDAQGVYCNRFDRGVVLNCFGFWLERNSDWGRQYDAGDQEMRRRGGPRLSFWSLTWLLRWQDDYNARHEALGQALVDLRVEKARRGAAVRNAAAGAANASQAEEEGKKT